MNIDNIKPSDMDNVITTSDKEIFADPRNDYQGHTKEWYDAFQIGYTHGYEACKKEYSIKNILDDREEYLDN